MKLREALDTYMFDNVGQFGGIAESLGYQTEYRDGYFRFRKEKSGKKPEQSTMKAFVTNQKNVYPPFLTRNVPMILNMSPSWRRRASASSGGRT